MVWLCLPLPGSCLLAIASSGRRRRTHLLRLQGTLYRAVAGQGRRQEYRAYRVGDLIIFSKRVPGRSFGALLGLVAALLGLVAAVEHVPPARLAARRGRGPESGDGSTIDAISTAYQDLPTLFAPLYIRNQF